MSPEGESAPDSRGRFDEEEGVAGTDIAAASDVDGIAVEFVSAFLSSSDWCVEDDVDVGLLEGCEEDGLGEEDEGLDGNAA